MATINDLYNEEGSAAGFSTLWKLRAAEVAESKRVNGNLSPLHGHGYKNKMHIHYPDQRGNVSPVIPIPRLTQRTCGNAIYWMYNPTQNTMIISVTFYPSFMYSRNIYI